MEVLLHKARRAIGRSAIVMVTVAVVLFVGLNTTLAAPSGAATTWVAVNLPVPGDYHDLVNEAANSISCPAAGNCVAVGAYDPPATYIGLLEVESNGAWSAITAPLPSDAATTGRFDYLDQVSCSSVGNCVAVGYYNAAADPTHYLPWIIVETNGQWTTLDAPLPADAIGGNQDELYSVSCPSNGNCTAVGYYNNATGAQALIVNEVGGVWSAVDPTPIPVDAGTDNTGNTSRLESVSCAGVGICTAVGWYYSTSVSDFLPFAVTLSDGAWSAVSIALPSDADSISQQGLFVYSVSCPAAGACAAGGTYDTAHGTTALLLSQSGGSWQATSPALPADADTSNPAGSGINAIHCAGSGQCTAAGYYSNSSNSTLPLLSVESGGTWTNVAAPLPSDLVANGDNQYYDVYCVTASNCLAQGGYYNATGELPLLGIETNGVWSQQPVTLPEGSGPTPGGLDGSELYASSCTQQGTCQLFGYSYSTTDSVTYPIVASGSIVGIPAAPTSVVATPGNGTATISWSAPTETGNSPIVSYTASAVASASDPTCTVSTGTSCTITGLTNGTSYDVTVTATNAAGTSAPSRVVTVVPHVNLASTGFDVQAAGSGAIALTAMGGGLALSSVRRRRSL